MFAFLVYQTFPAALFEMLGVRVGKWEGCRGTRKLLQLSEVVNAFTHKRSVAVAGAATPTLMGTAAVSVVSHSHCLSLPHTHEHTVHGASCHV